MHLQQQQLIHRLSSTLATRSTKPKQPINNNKQQKQYQTSFTYKVNKKGNRLLGLVKSEEEDVETLEVEDMLKTVSHQKKSLTFRRKQQLLQIHSVQVLSQDDYRHFMMVASQANYRKLEYPGYYHQLLAHQSKYPKAFFSCIDKDIPRTMPQNHPLQESLKNVLYAYAIRNPSLLYCQGMNYIVGFLLINKLSEEQTFWLMVQLIEDIVMPDYFKDLSTLSITVQVFQDLLGYLFPELAEEMKEVGMESGIFLVSWYICLFTKGFINSVSQYLLQEVVLQSYQYPIGFTLIRISVSILASLFTREQRFQFEQKDFKSLKESIETSVYEMSLSQLKRGLDYYQFDYEIYKELAEVYHKRRERAHAKAIVKQLNQKKLSLPNCNPTSPVCVQRVQIQKKIGAVEEVLILKNQISIQQQLITDYFPHKVNKAQPRISYDCPQECPITHHSHICKNPQKIIGHNNTTFQEQSSKYYPVFEGDCSIQVEARFSKIEDRFSEFSEYFVISDSLKEEEEEQNSSTREEQNEKEGKQIEIEKGPRITFAASISNTFKKALEGMKLLKPGSAQRNLQN